MDLTARDLAVFLFRGTGIVAVLVGIMLIMIPMFHKPMKTVDLVKGLERGDDIRNAWVVFEPVEVRESQLTHGGQSFWSEEPGVVYMSDDPIEDYEPGDQLDVIVQDWGTILDVTVLYFEDAKLIKGGN